MENNSILSTLCIGTSAIIAFLGFFFLILLPLLKKYIPRIYYCSWNDQHNWVWKHQTGQCIEQSFCSRCNIAGETRVKHAWAWKKVEGACLEKCFCSVCNEEGEERILEHEFGDWEKVENQCLEIKKCINCGEVGQERKSHTWSGWQRVEGYNLERKICIVCKELGSERKADQKTYCENCNGTGLVVLGGWNVSSACSVCGGTGVVKKSNDKEDKAE